MGSHSASAQAMRGEVESVFDALIVAYSHLKGAGIYKQSRMYKTLGDT